MKRLKNRITLLKRWRMRFRWAYLMQYDWPHRFAMGFVVLGILFYKPNSMVYYRIRTPRDAAELMGDNYYFWAHNVRNTAFNKLIESVPPDFGFGSISSYVDYDIDHNEEVYTIEGVAVPAPIFLNLDKEKTDDRHL